MRTLSFGIFLLPFWVALATGSASTLTAAAPPARLPAPAGTCPAIRCPEFMRLSTDAGQCSRSNVTFTIEVDTNCLDVAVSCIPASGATFNNGMTWVTCIATNLAGESNSCSFPVTVIDLEPPLWNCPTGMVVNTLPGQCEAEANYAITVTDNCGEPITVQCIPPYGSLLQKGTTNVLCTATDGAGLTSQCSFPLTVVASPAGPVVLMGIDAEDGCKRSNHGPISTWQTLCSNIIRQASGGEGILAIGAGKNPIDDVSWFWRAVGTGALQTVTFVTGSNAIATQSFAGFKMIGIASDSIQTPSGGLTTVENNALRYRAADIADFVNSGGALWGLGSLFSTSPPSAGPYPYMSGLGGVLLRQVTYSNIDLTAAGTAIGINSTLNLDLKGTLWHETFQVYPNFMQPLCYMANTTNAGAIGGAQVHIPLSCPNPVSIPCSDFLSLTAQVYNAECTAMEVVWDINGVPVQTNLIAPNFPRASLVLTRFFEPGQHRVSVTQLGSSLTNRCETLVIVDPLPPVFTYYPSSVTTNPEPGQCSVQIDFTVRVSETCSGVTNLVCVPPSGSVFKIGTILVVCTVGDGAGNTNWCNFPVTVQDRGPPVLTCPANIFTNTAPGSCQRQVNYAPVVTNNCSVVGISCRPPSGAIFDRGTTPVLCAVWDSARNTNTCSFSVVVLDTQPPQMTCPADIVTNAWPGECEVTLNYAATANDNCPGTTVICQPPSGSRFSGGLTPVRCVGTDADGQTNSCLFNVQVLGSLSITPLQDRAVCAGTPALFSITSSGSGNRSYHWRLDGQLQPTNGPELTLNTAPLAGHHTVEVVVSNECGQASSTAVLTVGTPLWATPLTNLTLCACQSANFSTVVAGAGPVSYTWRVNGQVLLDQTNSSLVLPTLKASDAGLYTLEIAGLCNTVTQSATLTLEGVFSNPAIFSNPGKITLRDLAVASPYPSSVQVKCLPGPATNVTATIFGLAHSYGGDIDMLLVNPLGQKLRLMSDAGNQAIVISNVTLIFEDAAGIDLPSNTKLVSGTYRPTNYDPPGESPDDFPAPAPAGPYVSRLGDLIGNANGTWSLYARDDTQADQGFIVGGWGLSIWWDAMPPVMVSALLRPDGHWQLRIQSLPGQPHVIEASADLQHWNTLHNYTVSGSTYDYLDETAAASEHRFYRVLRCP